MMKPQMFALACVLAAIPATTALRADLLENLTMQIRLGQRPPPLPPEVVVVVEDRYSAGPAPWERHRSGRLSQGFYYYPGTDVYYRLSDRMWFYTDRGRWRYGPHLPDSLRVDFDLSVTLSINGTRPYDYHQQVVARYPANYFGTRVRLRDDNLHDNRRDNNRRHDNRRDDNQGDENRRDDIRRDDNRRNDNRVNDRDEDRRDEDRRGEARDRDRVRRDMPRPRAAP